MRGADRPPHLARFESFELDVRAGELRPLDGAPVRLPEQSLRILVLLLEHPGEVVQREEIQKKLWPNDTIVEFEHSISAAMNRLRQALGDSADKPKYVETLARRGYRWMVPVEWADGTPALQPADVFVDFDHSLNAAINKLRQAVDDQADNPRLVAADGGLGNRFIAAVEYVNETENSLRRGTIVAAARARRISVVLVGTAILTLSVSAAYFFWRQFRNPVSIASQKVMLAVLPFENLSGNPDQEYFSDGLTEEVITLVSRVDAVRGAGCVRVEEPEIRHDTILPKKRMVELFLIARGARRTNRRDVRLSRDVAGVG